MPMSPVVGNVAARAATSTSPVASHQRAPVRREAPVPLGASSSRAIMNPASWPKQAIGEPSIQNGTHEIHTNKITHLAQISQTWEKGCELAQDNLTYLPGGHVFCSVRCARFQTRRTSREGRQ